ncbi:hypothetical protein G7Z17_g1010 [Cylindrodendrum hubeiense]|uniref:FAD/NAD(P)-binding domain-containing protein n=1 Tax=Cylindrodendrum hubeiense TaxID=595255 RepID=A0A9P5HNL2_9HYPO|nr:hypothetical protein G7Z17_g1010 [Cylindrodendrum hubeiense]
MALAGFRIQTRVFALFAQFAGRALGQRITSAIHRWTYRPSPNPRTVAVIGGSFGGTHLAQRLAHSLPSGFRVVLIEKHSHFHYAYGFPRFAVVPGLESKGFIQYDNLAQGAPPGIFRHVHGEALSVGDGQIELKDGTKLDYDYLAIATGAAQPPPARIDAPGREEGIATLTGYQQRIQRADRIAVVGGGAVGVELASEIKEQYPEKKVTLIHSRDRLLPRFDAKVHDYVAKALVQMEIEVIFNERPTVPADAGMTTKKTSMKFSNGPERVFDLVIPCTGLRPRSEMLLHHAPQSIASNGEILVNPTLQLTNSEAKIFAFGDVARTGGPKQGRACMMQAEIVLSNILRLIKGRQELKHYTPHPFEGSLIMTLGKMGQLMYMKWGKDELFKPGGKSENDIGASAQWKALHAKMPRD